MTEAATTTTSETASTTATVGSETATAATTTGAETTTTGAETAATAAAATEAATTTAAEAAATGAPEKYKFKLPEGVTLETARLEKVEALAREFNLTNDQAQKLVEAGLEQGKTFTDTLADTRTKTLDRWEAEAKADTEIGGAKFDASLATAAAGLEKFGTPAFKAFLEESGLGSHPEMIRLLNKVGTVISNDTPVPGSTQPAKKAGAAALYDNPSSQHS